MTYSEAIKFLYGLQVFGARPGLETTRQLAALAGNPQEQLRFIHVAGTNGKGSTCAMLESIYRAAGLRVGLFTSPHLVSFRERIQVNRQWIPAPDVARLAVDIQAGLKTFSEDQHPTMFEVVTVMALRHFAEQKCDLVIWETGLGGRLDATNIVAPLASVITNIGLDHQQWLGQTLPEIAAEKAGIIKAGVPVVTAEQNPESLQVIERVAREKAAALTLVGNHRTSRSLQSVALPGEHQQTNAALAVATVEVLQPAIPVSKEAMQRGLAMVHWPGRLQLLTRATGQQILLDGAHNLDGVKVLATALRSQYPNAKPTFILGVLGDKDWRAMCEILAPLAARILLVPVGSERTAKPEALAGVCQGVNPSAEVWCGASLQEALARADQDALVVIAGSLYLVGEALVLLDPNFQDGVDERRLNEWGGSPKSNQRTAPDATR
jgi:dihydrofolate synthase/folylpolyglutamate synthase